MAVNCQRNTDNLGASYDAYNICKHRPKRDILFIAFIIQNDNGTDFLYRFGAANLEHGSCAH